MTRPSPLPVGLLVASRNGTNRLVRIPKTIVRLLNLVSTAHCEHVWLWWSFSATNADSLLSVCLSVRFFIDPSLCPSVRQVKKRRFHPKFKQYIIINTVCIVCVTANDTLPGGPNRTEFKQKPKRQNSANASLEFVFLDPTVSNTFNAEILPFSRIFFHFLTSRTKAPKPSQEQSRVTRTLLTSEDGGDNHNHNNTGRRNSNSDSEPGKPSTLDRSLWLGPNQEV